jgi:serine/threonine-protein kinase
MMHQKGEAGSSQPDTPEIAEVCAEFAASCEEGLKERGELPSIDTYVARVEQSVWPTLRRELETIRQAYQESAGTVAQESDAKEVHPADGRDPGSLRESDRTQEYVQSSAGPPHVPTVDFAGESGDESFSLSNEVMALSRADQISVPGYEIVGELGRGAMGVVYKARQLGLNRWVALKMVLAGAHASAAQLARFKIEAEAVAHLQHPNIVQIYDIGEHEGLPYFSLEFVDGPGLANKIHSQPQPPAEAAHLVEMLARAMDYAHKQGIIHRDLKPENVLLTAEGVPKIGDFGLAKCLESDSSQTRAGTVMGSPSYMSPEQARGEVQKVGPVADVYALGAILYELLTGRPPFQAATIMQTLRQVTNDEPLPPTRLQPKVPRDLETVCLKCLQKDPTARYARAANLAEDLRRFLCDEPILARPIPAWERLARWCRRNPRVAALLGTVALLLVVVALGSLGAAYRISQEKAEAERQRELAELSAAAQKVAREEADRNAELARQNAAEARKAQTEASKQAQVALGTVYDVVTTADEKLRTRAEMGPLRKALLQLAMKRLDQISRDAATSGKADRTMGVALQRMGTFYEQVGMTDQQLEVYRRSLDIFNRLIVEQPDEDWNKFDAAISYDALGETGREIEPDPARLFDYYSKSLELRRGLVARPQGTTPTPYQRRRALAVSYVKLGTLSLEIGQPDRAMAYSLKALQESQAAAAQDPSKADDRRKLLSASHLVLAKACARLAREADARAHLRDCAALRQEMVQADALSAYAKQELARVEDALGDLEAEGGRPAQALEAYRRAQETFAALYQKDPANTEWLWYLGNEAYHLGAVLQSLGHREEAESQFRECLKVRERLLKDDPKNIQRRIELMLVQARLGNDKEAARIATEVRSYAPRHPGKLFAAACGYALCMPVAAGRETKGPLTPASEASRQRYAESAFEALRQAVASGFHDRRGLESSPDLAPLRGDDRFKNLLTLVAQP